MVARYGLDGRPAATYAEVGASLGLTKQRICQLHTEALVWLRQPAHSHMLRSLLDRHFDGLRPVLACRLGWTSARGYMPFDPVSSFLLLGWQITHRWTRAQTLRNLADPRYADYARRFGFQPGVFPTRATTLYGETIGNHVYDKAHQVTGRQGFAQTDGLVEGR